MALLLLAAAVGFAAKPAPVMLTGPRPCSDEPGRVRAVDPAIQSIRARQAVLRAQGDIAGARELERGIQAIQIQKTARQPIVAPIPVTEPPDFRGSFSPDQPVWSGVPFSSFACDYEQDPFGTMWVAVGSLDDSMVYVFNSTDHGWSWAYVSGFYWNPRHEPGKLQIAVGEGAGRDFVYVWELAPFGDGDLMLARINHDGSGLEGWAVQAGPDTVTDYAAGRDFSGSNYWLYARTYNGWQEGATSYPISTRLRCTDNGATWAVMDTIRNGARPSLSFGASYVSYLAAVPQPHPFQGYVQIVTDTAWWSPGYYGLEDFNPDTFRIWDAAIASDFNADPYAAVAWMVYSHNYQGDPNDWDVLYTYSTDVGNSWATWEYLAGAGSTIEAYVDLKNFTSDGNPYVNASYVITGESNAYLTYAEAGAPSTWAPAVRINQDIPVGWGPSVTTPRIIYSPYGPGPGGGLVFSNPTADGVYFNAPWFTGAVAEQPGQKRMSGPLVVPSVGRGPVRINWQGKAERVTITDVLGRVVDDIRQPAGQVLVWNGEVPAGTYLVRVVTSEGRHTRPVVVE
jgi:hypothetical protein